MEKETFNQFVTDVRAIIEQSKESIPVREKAAGQADYMMGLAHHLNALHELLETQLDIAALYGEPTFTTPREDTPSASTKITLKSFLIQIGVWGKFSRLQQGLCEKVDKGEGINLYDVTIPNMIIARIREDKTGKVGMLPRSELTSNNIVYDVKRFIETELPTIVRNQSLVDFTEHMFIYLQKRGWSEQDIVPAVQHSVKLFGDVHAESKQYDQVDPVCSTCGHTLAKHRYGAARGCIAEHCFCAEFKPSKPTQVQDTLEQITNPINPLCVCGHVQTQHSQGRCIHYGCFCSGFRQYIDE